jgi:hypothetical protein
MEISNDHSQVILTGLDLMQRPLLVFQISRNLPLMFQKTETKDANIISIVPKRSEENKEIAKKTKSKK